MRADKFGSLALVCWLCILLLLANLDLARGCGPGRAGIRRVMLRKYPPLVQRQYIPNVSENTLGASGKPEGPIRRKDKRFRELVQNRNPDIEFKDQERTGADRMMSQNSGLPGESSQFQRLRQSSFMPLRELGGRKKQPEEFSPMTRSFAGGCRRDWQSRPPAYWLGQRLKEKLSTLAISVMNQWPNVKLRVIEGWDEDNKHAVNSLHYEGRAVDITTSDRDKAKYGMLARLAVEAGFDWVHYEAKSHVHCSVKSERADSIRNNGCFEAGALVHTPAGPMQMAQLQTSDLVLAMDARTGRLHYSPVILWLDRDESGRELYVELRTKSNKLLRLTSSHLIYLADQPIEGAQGADGDKAQYYFYDYANHKELDNATSSANDGASDERLALEDVAYTTYARNALVGQYLLAEAAVDGVRAPPMTADQQQQPDNHHHSNELEVAGEPASGKPHKTSRLVFGGTKSANGNVQEPAGVTFDQIVSVNYVTRRGIYAPLTREGNIVVNSVVASCYAVISEHELAHMSFAPVRWLSYLSELLFGLKPATPPSERTLGSIGNRRSDRQPQQQLDSPHVRGRNRSSSGSREIHWYPATLYRIARLILPTKYLY